MNFKHNGMHYILTGNFIHKPILLLTNIPMHSPGNSHMVGGQPASPEVQVEQVSSKVRQLEYAPQKDVEES